MTLPTIDPVLIHLGPLAIRWYGVMYMLGFVAGYFILRTLARQRDLALDADGVSDLLFYCVFGVVLGGRLGYVLFYNLSFYLEHPRQILAVWEGGMSFHGGLLGVVVAALCYARRHGLPILLLGDVMATAATVGLGLGRLGNFINGELWGRVTNVPWGVIFPMAGTLPRHPSQLYEAMVEGPLLLFLLLWLHRRQTQPGVPLFTFFVGYGTGRFVLEFFRQPDEQLGFLWGGATMGQLLCLVMMAIGATGLSLILKRSSR